MTNLQAIMLKRLSLEFGVNTDAAVSLDGADLDQWIECAEDRLMVDLLAESAHDATA